MRHFVTRGESHSRALRKMEAIVSRTWLNVIAGVFFFRSPGFGEYEPTGEK